ncbi:cellulose synthase complex outer membrane protein BcsC [Salmonella enterica subsp. enterica]|uniref:cellulose synthase complex outer membrane protein BcsC n=1 Tax=Salmonella TaxID=590 RepID=UPI0009AAD3FF|nr:cellulose synthase complex outer membrane protein BcsC [Salmonella enterica]QUZ41791.1 cellulose biosynthesis protein BcsC [Salmonella enterica subsp. enterica serovar Pullorum str. CFSAN000606]WGZ40050.1 cellulose synthase complex outer membrane protein BcsC [Salmonella sp. CVCC 1806]AYE21676.1 cellulose biosynthesis protein BcsC [Salmonella enterica subsp. enterica serovar Pullorum]MBE5542482.1 cellulose biosynthesis protein BcsC [Salmonella enterica subsp. enterica serovar Gallinarum]MBE
MRKFTLSLMHAFLPAGGRNALPGKRGVSRALLGLSLGMALTPLAGAATSAQQQLLEQVRLGEATHREDLVRQSLYRLELIDPNDPQVIAARFRYLLRQGDSDGAQKLLDRLAQLAPESTAYQSSRTAMLLSTPQGRQSLQEARLLATTGHTEQAIASYDKLFKGYPPEGELAVEYWTTVAKLPARRHEAINQLQKINAVSPGNNALQNALAQLLFASGRRDEGFAVLKQMAKSSTGRSAASAIWYQQIKDLPVSDASVKALQDYLTQFSEGDSVSAARAQLSEQQKQLADPAFRARSQGIAAVNAGEGGKAIAQLQQARAVDNTDSYAVLGLGDVAMARKDNAAAERYYQQTLRMDSGNTNAVRGLANLYRQQSPQKAAAFIASLSASQRRSIDDIERSLENDRLAQQAETLESEGKWAQAAELHRRRLALDPGSVWVTYRLSRDLWQAGQHAQADAQMRSLAQQKPNDPEQVYAYGLYLSGSDRDRAALAHLNTLPTSQWNSNIQELAGRLQSNQVLESANRLRDSGKEREAEALLRQQPPSTRIALTLADWAQQRGDNAAARAAYDAVLAREPGNVDAMLGRVEIDIAQGDNAAARSQLAALPASQITSINMQRRVALAQLQLGDITAAARTFNRITPQAKAQPPSMESAMVLRDAAAFQAQTGEPQRALETYKEAMVAAAITPVRPLDNDTFTRLTRNDEKDDWLKRGVRSDAAELYRQQDLNVTLAHDYWGSSGTGGYSDLKAHTTMLQVDAPWSDGRAFFRTDMVNMDVGRFSTDADGKYDNNWGTCTLEKCSGHRSQADTGASVAVGWQNETWRWDIGTTPMGFNVVDVVGGVSYSDDIGPLGYTLNAHRRPISSSLLAFGGQKDASSNTGTKWGGVRANGGGVSLSYDKGEANGVWASLSGDQLSGKNVEDNWRVRWMTGYYYKVINENNRRVTVGLNNMIWHYDKDLSGYSLGQGGYYSPQEYLSFAVPVMWRQRTENWSWELGGSVSWSHSRNRTMPRYPLMNLIPADYQEDARDQTNGGGSSQGFGYTARALIERRVTANWFVGTAVDIQQAKDYTPSHLLLYVRYSAAGWQGDMDLPPQPLVPYADW